MTVKQLLSTKKTVVSNWNGSKNYMMAEDEFTGIVVGKESTASEYVISNGVIAPGAFISRSLSQVGRPDFPHH
ncbi:hypothetical protein [Sulfitobacter sp. SK011]|uniref:hypothetical protein n=1 Tax=Sulfitobacter sp. SK011 TaxID=1389004 RepID=UPI0013B3FA1D|nr:hypothetical protein [Sulfitobacter sp. SK011]